MNLRTEQDKPDDGGTTETPRIVNGMPYRPRKPVDVWKVLGVAGVSAVPDVLVLLFAATPFVVRGILKYLDSKGWLPNPPDAST